MCTLREKRIKVLKQIGRYQRTGEFPFVREIAIDLGLAGESSLRTLLDHPYFAAMGFQLEIAT